MSDYIFFIRGGDAYMAGLSEQEMQNHMQEWTDYMGSLGAAGKLKGGAPLGKDGTVMSGGAKAAIDGPLGGDTQVNGYVIVSAADMAEAKKLANDCPIFMADGSLEIRECLDMSG